MKTNALERGSGMRIDVTCGVEFAISRIVWTESRWNRSRVVVLRMNRCEDSEQISV